MRTLRAVDYSGALIEEPRIDPATGHLYVTGYGSVEGICEYDGVRELVTKQSIRDQVALCARRPMTDGHPDGWVDADNARELVVGEIGDGPVYEELPDPALGGYSRARCVVQPSARQAPVIADIRSGKKRGLSFGYTKEIDDTPGVHEVFGPYDRVRTRVTAVNHLAFCEVPRVEGSTLLGFDMADPIPRSVPMNREQRRKLIRDNKAVVARILDALRTADAADEGVSLEKVKAFAESIKSDKTAKLVLMAILEEGAEEPMDMPPGEPVDPKMKPEGMDAAISAALAPLRAEIEALKTARATEDAAAKAKRDADALADVRGLAKRYGLATADSSDAAACLSHLRAKLGASGSDAEVLAVARYAANLPAPVLGSTDAAPITPAFEV